ncbi:MAG: cation diffusion facilitator family transporter [Gammaproteobacteria bacterium]|nr:cation diffusion facilitator family transporter [Gammaproteobacteria bacterium]MBU1555475.1 cation diffusion facilitator family transporter [Gammaproteobacteria bacterium]MBU2072512.1 cation diffusion facilitator family transporter [Gammaproteobacteria bacterium]MBU2181938.1 cation diffusion facilitator family transporter [Gammaproteobacteria bacterium]MBU2204244.1 cation diffusion facilitator family transporter [Gammaproteobacteria bacterium]
MTQHVHQPHSHASHQHPHGHNHTPAESSNIALAFWLNFGFALIEIVGGILTNSVAIIADAIHDLGDSLAIAFAWVASKVAAKQPTQRYSYGYRRWSLLSALISGVILLLGSAWVLSEAIPRLWQPQLPHTGGMFLLALLGIAVNGAAVLRLRRGKTQNEKVLSWHLLEDVLGWVAVLLGSVLMYFTGWAWLDPALSIAFTLFILLNVLKALRQTLALFLQVSPDLQLQQQISSELTGLDFVESIHHLHLWSLDGEQHVLTMHVEIATPANAERQLHFKQQIAAVLAPYKLSHTTIEFEISGEHCRDGK